jgi:NADH:ubiquinone oxidoreductase subunit D
MNLNTKINLLKNSQKLNFGPQHPAAHGVLRGVLFLKNEIIKNIEIHIGLLHRATEKLIENKNALQIIPYFDRLDYVSMLSEEHAFVLIIEKLKGLKVSKKTSYSRMLLSELTRILNHLMGLTTHAIDIGAFTPFLWGFEDREKLMELYEQISGARMHAAFFLPGNLRFPIKLETLLNLKIFFNNFIERLNELSDLLSKNPIWISRLKNVGIIDQEEILNYGFSGPIARSSGLIIDIRKNFPYEAYSEFNLQIPVVLTNSQNCDSLDRYYIRLFEMHESTLLILKLVNILIKKYSKNNNSNLISMENIIKHFKSYSNSDFLQANNLFTNSTTSLLIETPKGEFGCYASIKQNNFFNKCFIRASGFSHINYVNIFNKETYLSDLVTLIGSLDLVFGEIDR